MNITACVHTCTRSEQASWGPPAGNPAAPGSPHQCMRAASSRQQTLASASTPERDAAISPLMRKKKHSVAERLKIQQWNLRIQQRACISSLVQVHPPFPSQCLCLHFLWCACCPLVYDQGSESPRSVVSCTKYIGGGTSSTSFFVLFWFFSHYFCPSPSLYQHLAGFLFSQVCCFFIQVILKLLQLLLRRKHFARIN